MSVIDGGSFKCSQHEKPYETTKPADWEAHIAEEHTESGVSVCVICGTQTEYSKKPMNKRAVCDKCKEDLK